MSVMFNQQCAVKNDQKVIKIVLFSTHLAISKELFMKLVKMMSS